MTLASLYAVAYAPEQEHEGFGDVTEVVVMINLTFRIQFDVAE